MFGVSIMAVLIATVCAMLFGSLWYGPLFGKQWQEEVKLNDAMIKNADMKQIFGGAIIATLITSFFMAKTFTGLYSGMADGIKYGLLIGVGFIATAFATNYLFAGKSRRLFFIDAGYHVCVCIIIGMIIGIFS